MSFCSTIYGNLPDSGFVYTATTVSVENGSFENLSATNATIVNLETTTFNPTNVDCTTLTADDATITDITATNATIDNLEVTTFRIDTLNATTANISTINSSISNSIDSNISNINCSNLVADGTIDAFSVEATQMTATSNLATPFVNTTALDTESINIKRTTGGTAVLDIYGDKLDIDGGFSDAGSVTARGVTIRAGNDVAPAIEVGDDNGVTIRNLSSVNYETDNISCDIADITTINTSQVNASNISTKNLSAVIQITSTFIDATNRMSAPVLNTQLNNVSIINGSTINSQIGNFSTTNILNNNVSSVFLKRSTGGKATLDMTTTQILDIDGGFLDSGNVTARGITLRAGNNITPAISVGNDNGVVITNLSSVNFETDNLTADNFNSTTSNISNLNVSILNASTKNSQTMNASTINCSTINSSFCNAFSMDTSIITSKIFQLEDATGGGGADGVISESSNELTIRTGASGGVTKFGTTTGGNFSVQIANDALNASTINTSQLNATDIDATTIDADTITGDIAGNLAAGTGISLSTTAGVTTISNTGSITDPLNLSKLNVSNISGGNLSMSHGTISGTIESAISKATIFEVLDSGGGGGPDGFIYETSNEMTLATGATGGVIRFGTTYSGNFSVNIANDALNASTANISTINSNTGNITTINASVVNSDFINGNIANNLAAGTNITLSTTGGVTTINSAGGSVTDPLNLSTLNASTGNIAVLNTSIINSDFINGNIANNLAAGTNITLSTSGGVTTINSAGGSVSDPLNLSTLNASTNNASIFISDNGYKMVGGATNNTAGGIGSAFGNSAAFGHVSQVLGTNTYAISQTSGGKTFVNCAPTEELGFYHGGSEKITITATEVDIRQDCNMSTSNTSTSNALVANMSQANASNMSLINLSADLITGDISPNLTAGTGITLSTTSGVTTINNSATGTSQLYYFRATSNIGGNQTINTNTVLSYNVSTYDVPNGNYDTTTNSYVVPIAGTWQFFFQAYQNSSVTTGFRLGIYKNGTKQVQTGGSVGNSERCGVILECAVGDIIDVRGSAGSALVFMDNEFSWFEGHLLAGSSQLSTSQQYYFRARGTTSQTVNSGNTLNFTQTTYDVPSGNYDTTNKRYVVPIAGIYQFFFQAFQTSSTTTPFRLGIYKNGSVQVQTGDKSANTERAGVILECAVGDLIDVKGAYGTGVVELADSFGWFEGYLLQPENNTVTTTTDLTTNSLTTSTTNVSNSNISNLTINNNLNGYSFIRTIAIAKILGGGANSKAVGCSVTRTAVGRYTCTISPARPNDQYVVQLTCMETSGTLDDVIIHVQDGTMATTGFNYFIHEQDNGGTPGAYRDRNHFISIFDTD